MTCTLHIGTAKTGSTSIQNFFYHNREGLLEKYNILYPQFDPNFRTGVSHRALSYYAAGSKLLSDPKWNVKSVEDKHQWERAFQKNFRYGIKNEFRHGFKNRIQNLFKKSPDCEHYFLSSEHLHSRITKKSQVAHLVKLLSEFFDEINIVIFLKPQSSLAVSRFSTLLKSGKVKDDIFNSLTNTDIFYDYHKFLTWWAQLVGKDSITIKVMDDCASQPIDSVDEMCSILGVDKHSLSNSAARRNTYLGASALEFLNILNQLIVNNNLKISLELRKSIIHTLEKIHLSDKKYPDRKSAMLFDQLYSESNQLLAKDFGLCQPSFTVDYSKYPLMKTMVPFSKVQQVFSYLAQHFAENALSVDDQKSWEEINQFFCNRMKIDKLSSDYGPDFACVGFPKCATTFILKRFAEYSFDTLVKGEFKMIELENYRSKIKEIHDRGTKVAIKNPNIIFSRNLMDQLQRSECKIIISIRNPVRWLKSFYNYRLKRINQGVEHLPESFDKIPDFSEIVKNDMNFMGVSVKRGMMAKIITENLLKSEHYDPDRVHYEIQEEFEADHDKVQTELLDFLDIEDSKRINREYKFDYNKKNRWKFFDDDDCDAILYQLYAEEIRDICSLVNTHTGKDLRTIWENFYSIKISS